MPTVLGIPLIGFIQIVIGAAIITFVLLKYLTRPHTKKDDEFIIQNVHIIVGDGSELSGQNVYIKKGLIKQISACPISAKNAQIIDGTDKTLMPGLIDCHVHIQGINNRSTEDSDRFLREQLPQIFTESVLPYGVTTIKDLCAPRHFILKLKNELKSGRICGPELVVVGPNFTAPDGHPANTLGGNNPWIRKEMSIEVTSPEQVSKGISELKKEGVDFLKFTYQGGDYWYFNQKLHINKLDKALMQQIISEGKAKGLQSTAHVFYKEDVRELLEAGIYGIEHGILDAQLEPDDDIIKLWQESGAHFVPTVNAMTYEKEPTRLPNSLHNLKVLYDVGIPIALGTDNMLEMMSESIVHKELAYYVEAGLTPMQAIQIATLNSAVHLGIADRKGAVKEGMEADLILLDKNPASDITNIELIDKVFLQGKIVFSQKIIQAYNIPDYKYPDNISALKYARTDADETKELELEGFSDRHIVTQTIRHGDRVWSEETFTLASNMSVVEWHYKCNSGNTDLCAVKENDIIRLTGTFKGKQQDKKFQIGNRLWYQMMDLSMPAFISSDENEILFYSIGTGDNRGAMGLGEFAAKKLGEEDININGKTYSCIKISFVLTMFSWAWTGLYWYDKETCQLVRSGEKKGNKEVINQTITSFEKLK